MNRRALAFCLVAALWALPAAARDLSLPPLEIKGAKVSTEAMALQIAFGEYVQKMRLRVLAQEGVQDVSVVSLGLDIRDFGKTGDKVWETRIGTFDGKLRAILWVHSQSEKTLFVIGPWE
jgi:hypothetical protein